MRTYEDFTEGLAFPLGPYPVTLDAVLEFAREFDPQPFHLDEQAGSDSMLGGLSASGWHTCAIMMRMMIDSCIRDSSSQGSPGVDFVRWQRPVRPGDMLTGVATVGSRRLAARQPTLGRVKLVTELRNQRDEAVLQSEYTLLLLTRAGVAA